MGVKSLEIIDRLFWLGRYSERTYTTLKLYEKKFDSMIEAGEEGYDAFCRSLDIPNIYTSAEDFRRRYPFGKDDPNSVYSNLMRAYDNAVELREEIGSEALAYIQLAVYEIKKAAASEAPLIEFQTILDYILAFWGIVDDTIEDEDARNIIKVGKMVERIDLFGRLRMDRGSLERAICRLESHLSRTGLSYRKEALGRLRRLAAEEAPDCPAVVWEIEHILEV